MNGAAEVLTKLAETYGIALARFEHKFKGRMHFDAPTPIGVGRVVVDLKEYPDGAGTRRAFVVPRLNGATQFPELQGGGFSYDKIIERIFFEAEKRALRRQQLAQARTEIERAEAARADGLDEAKAIVRQLREEGVLGMNDDRLRPLITGKVKLEVTLIGLDEAEARKAINALKFVGLWHR